MNKSKWAKPIANEDAIRTELVITGELNCKDALPVEEYEAVAWAAIEKHLGDVCDEESSPEDIREEIFTVITDALVDIDCPDFMVKTIAKQISEEFTIF